MQQYQQETSFREESRYGQVVQTQQTQQQTQQVSDYSAQNGHYAGEQETYYREREEDSQAPPDLEPVTPQPSEMVGEQESYEPSADELIDVLKNLENLAAANPALYKTIVAQIKEL